MVPVSHRGPDLAYSVVAGVIPCGPRWLVASAKMAAATFAPEEPQLLDSFGEVLVQRPAFVAIVVGAPIGYLDRPGLGSRSCDRAARALLGRRALTVHDAPTRATFRRDPAWPDAHLDAVTATLLPRFREVAAEMSPFRQRVVYSGHPELSFYQLNDDVPLRWSKRIEEGRLERRAVLEEKVPGVRRILDAELAGASPRHLFDAAALLWSARRVFGRAAKRLPADAEWDNEGLRMEMVL